jgi:hypothetical protein
VARSKKPNALLSMLRSIGIMRIIIFAALGITGAWLAAALAISGVVRIKAPMAALAVMPNESIALAARGDQLLFENQKNPPRAVQTLALAALREQPLNPKAVRLLGFYADAQRDQAKAEKFMLQAEKLSRREIGTQLWLIEAQARRNKTAETLAHYDIALRTKPITQDLLFPRLLNAIEDGEIRTALKPYIRKKSGWGTSFLFYANANSKNLPTLVDLVVESGGLVDAKSAKNQELALLSRLVAEGYFADARRLFLQMPGAQAIRMTSAAFDISDRNASFGAMGWQLLQDPDAGGGFVAKQGDTKSALSLYANSATTRPVATKLLYLKPGNYSFTVRLEKLTRGDSGFLRWQLRCPQNASNPTLWSIDTVNIVLSATFSVPTNCPEQFLDLIVSGGKGQTGLEATVSSVSVLATN